MKQIYNFDFRKESIKDMLAIEDENSEVINFESFILVNPKTDIVFPENDRLFFERMDATLKHILYCYEHGWIRSERQVFYTSNECLTTLQFVFREDRVMLNVFQRSSNLNNLKEDIEFLNYFLERNFPSIEKELNVFVSMPHVFKHKLRKVDN